MWLPTVEGLTGTGGLGEPGVNSETPVPWRKKSVNVQYPEATAIELRTICSIPGQIEVFRSFQGKQGPAFPAAGYSLQGGLGIHSVWALGSFGSTITEALGLRAALGSGRSGDLLHSRP